MRGAFHHDGIASATAPHERLGKRMKSDRMGTRRLALALVLAGLPLAACEGDNMFTGDSVELLPRVTDVSVPLVAFAGETVNVRVDATAAHGISDLVVALRGAVVRDTAVEINPPRSRLSHVLSIPVPDLLQDTLLVVEANVIDQLGNVSRVKEATVVVFGPPTITNLSAPTVARPGEPISVRVTAFGSRKISLVDVVARGAIDKDSTIAVLPPRNNVTQDLVLVLPISAGDTLLTLTVGVRDEIGQTSGAVTKVVPLAIEPPAVQLDAPATANAGMYLDVDVHAQAVRQVSELRLELRGAVVKDTVVKVTPTQSALTQHIAVPLPGGITLPELRVRAIAVDRGGAVAYSDTKTVTIPLGPPVVTSVEVPTSVKSGNVADVRIRAQGDRPLARIDVYFRGAADSTRVFQIVPQRMSVVQDASVGVPLAPKDLILVVSATATDVSGAVSEIVSQAIMVIVQDTSDSSTVASLMPRRPLLPAPVPVWTLAGPAGEPAGVALPGRRHDRLRVGRKRRA
jgi:hypothetical protein